ncbi:MAG TPA: VOC family protein [Rubrobacter sp.]|nr:VOC family protein [Rubrobacter sp.]
MEDSRYSPTREAVFTETMQIGIVVRDLDATLRNYVDDFGIGPWQVHEFDPESAEDMREQGQPVEPSGRGAVTRFATTMIGGVMWELIEPLDEDSIWARFLAEKGEGVHHIAVATPSFKGAVAEQTERGNDLVLSGTFSGIDLAYLPTGRDLGVITEIFSGMPEAEQEPDT